MLSFTGKAVEVKARVLRPFSEIFPAQYWSAELNRRSRYFDGKLLSAELSNDGRLLEQVRRERAWQIAEPAEIAFQFHCEKLVQRAWKLGIVLDDIPLPEFQNSHWDEDRVRSVLTEQSH